MSPRFLQSRRIMAAGLVVGSMAMVGAGAAFAQSTPTQIPATAASVVAPAKSADPFAPAKAKPGDGFASAKPGSSGLGAPAKPGFGGSDAPSKPGPGGPGAPGKPGPGPKGGPAGPVGTIASISASSLTLTGRDGSTLQLALAPTTTFVRADKLVTASDIKSGDRVRTETQISTDGSRQVVAVSVELARADGKVTAVNGGTMTIAGKDAATRSLAVASDATVKKYGRIAAIGEVKVGDDVHAEGTLATDGTTFTALKIDVRGAQRDGVVTRVDGSTITVTGPRGSTTFTTTGTTLYLRGETAAQAADIVVGARVRAEGNVDSNGAFTAAVARIDQPRLRGKLLKVDSTTFYVLDRGFARAATTSGSTRYQVNGAAATATDLKVGDQIEATGTLGANGSFAATTVTVNR